MAKKPKSDGTLKIKNPCPLHVAKKLPCRIPFAAAGAVHSRKRRSAATVRRILRRGDATTAQYATTTAQREKLHRWRRSATASIQRRITKLQSVGVATSAKKSRSSPSNNPDRKFDTAVGDCCRRSNADDDRIHVDADGRGLNCGYNGDVQTDGDSSEDGNGSDDHAQYQHGPNGYDTSYGGGAFCHGSVTRRLGRSFHGRRKEGGGGGGGEEEAGSHQHGHRSEAPIGLSSSRHSSFAGKYMPKCFEEVVGQGMVVKALSNALIKAAIAPLYLFHGPRGTGKTSVARLFAASINCSRAESSASSSSAASSASSASAASSSASSASSNRRRREKRKEVRAGKERKKLIIHSMPCGSCKQCEKLLSSRSSSCSIHEIDAACHSQTQGGGMMRSFLRQINSHASSPRVRDGKVFIIDECHFLPGEAWDSILSNSSNSNSNNVFILITTSIEQLPRAVVSRCHRLAFPKVACAEIASRMEQISALEGIEIERDALRLIAARSDGSLREAEITLDQLSSFGQKITVQVITEMVGLVPDGKLVELLELAFSADDVVGTVRCTRELVDSGIEPTSLLSQLAGLITDLLAGDCTSHGFFGRSMLSREDVEMLRQALKVLSKAEKQVRICGSSSRACTWLIAALLQLSSFHSSAQQPHHHHHQHHITESNAHESYPVSARTSVTQSPLTLLETSDKETGDLPCLGNNMNRDRVEASNIIIIDAIDADCRASDRPQCRDHRPKLARADRREANPRPVDPSQQCLPLRRIRTPSSVAEHCSDSLSRTRHVPNVAHNNAPCGRSKSVMRKSARRIRRPEAKSSNADLVRCADASIIEPLAATDLRRDIIEPGSELAAGEVHETGHSTMDALWEKLLEGSPSSVLRQILSGEGKLVSLSVSEAYAIAHLEFRSIEGKHRADARKGTIAKSFQMALGCPVQVSLSLAGEGEIAKESPAEELHGPTTQSHKVKACQRKKNAASRRDSEGDFVADWAEFLYADQKDPPADKGIRRSTNHRDAKAAGLCCDGNSTMVRDSPTDASLTKCAIDEEMLLLRSIPTHCGRAFQGCCASRKHSAHDRREDDRRTKERFGAHQRRQHTTIQAEEVIDAKLIVEAASKSKADKVSMMSCQQSFGGHGEPDGDDMESRTPVYKTGLLCCKVAAPRSSSTSNPSKAKIGAERRVLCRANLSMIGAISTLAGAGGRSLHRER